METSGEVKSIRTIETDRNIMCVKYTNSRKSIAAGSIDGSVKIFDIKNNEHEVSLTDADTKHVDNAVTGIAFHPNQTPHTLTCSYSGGVVKQWNTITGECMFSIKEKREVLGILYHPKQARFITYGDDGKIYLYDAETRNLQGIYQSSVKKQLDGHITKIFAACFHPTSQFEFVTGSWDRTVHFWDMRVPASTRYLSDVFICGEGLTIHPAGNELVTCEWKNEASIRLWDYSTGKFINTLTPDPYRSQLYCGKYLNKLYVAVGGSNENMLRIIDRKMETSVGAVRGLSGGVCSLDYLQPPPTKSRKSDPDFRNIPPIVFCTGKCIYEVRFQDLN